MHGNARRRAKLVISDRSLAFTRFSLNWCMHFQTFELNRTQIDPSYTYIENTQEEHFY